MHTAGSLRIIIPPSFHIVREQPLLKLIIV